MKNIEKLQKVKSEKQLFLFRPQDHNGHIVSFKGSCDRLFWNKQTQQQVINKRDLWGFFCGSKLLIWL